LPEDIACGEELDCHITIMAVECGWHEVRRICKLDPLWEYIECLDTKTVMGQCGRLERLCFLKQIRMLLKSRVYHGVIARLPKYLLPRPSQLSIDHAPVADYFVWPGVREHFVFAKQSYRLDAFAKAFLTSIRIVWPYDFRDAYLRDLENGLYRFSPTLMERFNDLRYWTVKRDFITLHPEFEGDVGVYDPSPTALFLDFGLSPPRDGIMYYDEDFAEAEGEPEKALIW